VITGLKYVDAFMNKMAQTAQSVAEKWKVPASIVIAQAALETNWRCAVKGNAYFGVKQGASSGAAIAFTTSDFIDGQKVTLVDRFRKYKGLNDAANAYGQPTDNSCTGRLGIRRLSNTPATLQSSLRRSSVEAMPQIPNTLRN
jgi:hypothetical protein